jgi:hypothetical protein
VSKERLPETVWLNKFSSVKRIEDFMNWLTDMDSGWWPVVSFRPPKDRDIDNRVLFKISPVFGSAVGLLAFFYFVFRRSIAISVTNVVIYILLGYVVFFVLYKFTFAYFWNRRARRLRNGQMK